MQLYDLYNLAEQRGITVISFNLPESEAMSVMLDGNCYIGIDPFSLDTYADEKVKLGHEIGHCEMGAFYNEYSPLSLRSQCERRADIWAIKKLIPKDELIKAFKNGIVDKWDLADYFDVTEDFITKAAEYYGLAV